MINPKTKQRELAYVVQVDEIIPIEGADKVEQARVGGWHIMVRKGQFKPGDYAIYFEIDSKVPAKEPYMFLAQKHFKIKTQKYFKGTVISQGLLMAFEDFEEANGAPAWLTELKMLMTNEDFDPAHYFLTEALGVTYSVEEDNKRKSNITKYDKMYQRHLELFKKHKWLRRLFEKTWGKKLLFIFLGKKRDTRNWPAWVVKTDEERVQNMPFLFPGNPDKIWMVTEKIDGSSTTFTIKGRGRKQEFYVCSRNVCFDKPEKTDRCYYDTNIYLEMAEKYNVQEQMKKIFDEHKDWDFFTIQGETYGKNVQNRDYGLEGRNFMAFNVIYSKNGIPTRMNPAEMTRFLAENTGIPTVPILDDHFVLPEQMDDMIAYADGCSMIDGEMREGVVLRTTDGVESFKSVSNEFLIKYHQ